MEPLVQWLTGMERPQSIRTRNLATEAARSVSALIESEVDEAKEELQRDTTEAAVGVAWLGAAAIGALCGIELVVLGVGGVSRHPTRSTAIGLGLLGLSSAAALAGIAALPKRPMSHTKERLEQDFDAVRGVLLR